MKLDLSAEFLFRFFRRRNPVVPSIPSLVLVLSLAFCFPFPSIVFAKQPSEASSDIRGYKANFFSFKNELTRAGNETAVSLDYSLRYDLNNETDDGLQIFAAYEGAFDFYAGTRESDPVVNRVSRPSLVVRYSTGKSDTSKWWPVWSSVAVEHTSNGQATEPTKDNYRRCYGFEEGSEERLSCLDGLSRSYGIYFALEARWKTDWEFLKLFDLKLNGLRFVPPNSNDQNVWKDGKVERWDLMTGYDVFDLFFQGEIISEISWGLRKKIGGEWEPAVDFYLAYEGPFCGCDFARSVIFKYHFGPLARLSEYYRHDTTVSVGYGVFFEP